MPEGDTLWNIAHRLGPLVVGHRVDEIEVHRPRYPAPRPGTRIDDVTAVGKHLLVTFDGGTILHTHLLMAGEWHVYRVGERWRDSQGAVRVRLRVNGLDAICFRAPTADVYPPKDPRQRPWLQLGPDLCRDGVDHDDIIRRASTSDSRREIADVLLDQRIAAGIGNVYKSETLWACRTDPFAPLTRFGVAEVIELYDTASRLLRANLGRAKRQTFQRSLAVYGRANRDCPRCHQTIRIERQGDLARLTYWCPACQTRP